MVIEQKENLDFTHSLSYKHMAQKLGYPYKNCNTMARAIQEYAEFNFKSNIISVFEQNNFSHKEAQKYFNCTPSTLTYYLRKYNIEYLVKESNFNHKVVSIEWLYNVNEPVYDITVPEYHNFALYNGIFVHNSHHKDLGDSVAGSTWNCANSDKVINTNKIIRQYYSGGGNSNASGSVGNNGRTYTPELTGAYTPSNEILEYSQIKQNMANVFKGISR